MINTTVVKTFTWANNFLIKSNDNIGLNANSYLSILLLIWHNSPSENILRIMEITFTSAGFFSGIGFPVVI